MYMFTFVGYVVISHYLKKKIDDITTFRVISAQKTDAISLQNGLKNAYHQLKKKIAISLHIRQK